MVWRDEMSADPRQDPPKICISIDVERDYRLDGRLTTHGIDDGLPDHSKFRTTCSSQEKLSRCSPEACSV